MGGSSKKSTTDNAATPTPQQATMTMPAFMPGMQQALADQLAVGYGQQPADLMTYLSSIYKPMTVPDYSPQAAPTPATPSPQSTATPAPRALGQSGSQSKGPFLNRSRGRGS